MDPIIILPIALAVAWAASRNKKKSTTKKAEPEPLVDPPPPHDDPVGPFDGGDPEPEPSRPDGPDLPKPPQDGPVGPKPFPGPQGGPKSPELGDPRPTEVFPGTTSEEIEAFENAAYGLFISSDCQTVYEGEQWWNEVFYPEARKLVLDNPEAYHYPTAVIYELLVMPPPGEDEPETSAQACVAAWGEFVYGDVTPVGTFSGWIDDPNDEYWDYSAWFDEEYPALSELLWDLHQSLWLDPEFAEVFDQPWPEDEPEGDIDFDPTGS